MPAAKRRADVNWALAMPLFEKGYPEDLVERALKTCKTLNEALAWLKGQIPKPSTEKRPTTERRLSKRPSLATDPKPRASLGVASSSSQDVPTLRLSQKVETCAICFTDAPATSAVRLECRHGWYCMHCMKMHAQARLNVGDVSVPCPECRTPIQEFNLKEILSSDVIANFHSRSIKQAIACSPNLFTCPTANCDMCVELEPGEDAHLRKCPKCRKGSCLRCGAQPYHKGMTCQMYALQSRSSTVKSAEMSLRRWMRKTGTKQCPQCHMGVTKEDLQNQSSQRSECHKMLCRHCGTRFCFRCLAILSETYTCGCSMDAHGFVNPLNGRRIVHLRDSAKSKANNKVKLKGKGTAKAKASTRKATAAKVSASRGGRRTTSRSASRGGA